MRPCYLQVLGIVKYSCGFRCNFCLSIGSIYCLFCTSEQALYRYFFLNVKVLWVIWGLSNLWKDFSVGACTVLWAVGVWVFGWCWFMGFFCLFVFKNLGRFWIFLSSTHHPSVAVFYPPVSQGPRQLQSTRQMLSTCWGRQRAALSSVPKGTWSFVQVA